MKEDPMWDPDNFPGASNVPWQLLIRARLVHEIDAVLASTIVTHLGAVASTKTAHIVAIAAQEGVAGANREAAAPEQRVAAFDAALEWDDWCGTPWPHRWPPRPRGFDDLSDPVTELVIVKALELVRRGGSEELQKTLGSALADLAPGRS
jgi:hypothetical protein